MSIRRFFNRISGRADLLEAMMEKLGIGGEMRQLPDHVAVMQRAVCRCLT